MAKRVKVGKENRRGWDSEGDEGSLDYAERTWP